MKISKEEILASLHNALAEQQFIIHIQPQFNHYNKHLVGGEALVRWIHPQYGFQSPADFIPVFEDADQLYQLDLYVFERVCEYQRIHLDLKEAVVPISFNVSRSDLFKDNFIDEMEKIRKKYNIPINYLRVEITESSAFGGIDHVVSIVNQLHDIGYLVEMDDFGSGYSSLNVLKDINVDIIKLDLNFFKGEVGGRGGIIISSIVNMAKWLNTPIIAEGVESLEQADYMLSIGCEYIQGYYYSKPLPTGDFNKLCKNYTKSGIQNQSDFISNLDVGRFWSPESLETLIFSNYVGGAAILLFDDKDFTNTEILRVNNKYLNELAMNLSEKEVIVADPWMVMDKENRDIYLSTLRKALSSKKEECCETWREFSSDCCGSEKFCIRSDIQLIGTMDSRYLFYIMIRNITNEKLAYLDIIDNNRKLMAAGDQIQLYAWEYVIATKEMHPCFRCMRDLGLPAIIYNYPEPVIESGLFPIEIADEYRAIMERVDKGDKGIDCILPLTARRIPFRIRYTIEFDTFGNPIKAFGSAALVGND